MSAFKITASTLGMALFCVLICSLPVNRRAERSWRSLPWDCVGSCGLNGLAKVQRNISELWGWPSYPTSQSLWWSPKQGPGNGISSPVWSCSLFRLLSESGGECVLFLYINKTRNESSLRAPLRSHCYSWLSLVFCSPLSCHTSIFPGLCRVPSQCWELLIRQSSTCRISEMEELEPH